MTSTALITGGMGFVGPYLRKLLEAEGMDVYDFDIRGGGDVRDYESLRMTIEAMQPDYIFHLAAQAYVPESWPDPHRTIDVNVSGTLNLLDAVRNTGSHARVLLAGTSEEYGYNHSEIEETTVCEPSTPYGVSKLAAGQLGLAYAHKYGLPVVVTRAFNHTGPGHAPAYAIPAFAKKVAEVMAGKAEEVTHGNLEAVRNYTDVRDMVRAYRILIDKPSDIYNVCSNNTVSLQSVLDDLIALSGMDIYTSVDERLYRSGSSSFPRPWCIMTNTWWQPEIEFSQTLSDVLDYWKENV
jgi:GDP-4-dehydro-6-deoxy-D-mannose reductase